MNAAHIHLMLTHFPIVGTFIGVGILTAGLLMKNESVKKVALGVFILMALVTIPVFSSGEGAEEVLEKLPDFSKHQIHEHEELAEKAILLMFGLGILSVVGLFSIIKKISFEKPLIIVILIVSIATFGLFGKVGNLGGQVRHTEIRETTGIQIIDTIGNQGNTTSGNEKSKQDNDEDDD